MQAIVSRSNYRSTRRAALAAVSYLALTNGLAAQEKIDNNRTNFGIDAYAQAVALPTINVSGQSAERGNGPVVGYVAKQSVTATKTDTPVLETPQSVSIVTKDQVATQQAQSMTQALRYTPGVTIDTYGPLSFFNPPVIRGFQARQYLDGLYLPFDPGSQFAQPVIEPYNLERIEVLKGPSSGLYGQTNPGGLVNMVSKRPLATPHFEAVGQYGSFDRFQGAFDFGGAADPNAHHMFRFVGLARAADTQIDFVQDNKLFFAPSYTFRLSNDTILTILTSYQKIENRGFQQHVPGQGSLVPNPNGRIPFSRYVLEPSHDRYQHEQAMAGYAFEHRFNEVFQFRQNLRYTSIENNLNALRTEGLLADLRTDRRSTNYVLARSRSFGVDNQLQADFATGPLRHKLLVGVDYLNIDSHSDYRSDLGALTPTLDIFAPAYGAPVPPVSALTRFVLNDYTQRQTGVYVQDQIKWDRFSVFLTGRHDRATQEVNNRLTGTTSKQADDAFTGRVAANYLFDFGLAPYLSYSTSFLPTSGATFVGTPFKPTTGEATEFGVKYQPVGMNLLLTAAAFDITQQNVLTADPVNAFFQVQTGEVNVRGFELEARGNVTREVQIIGGYSYLDPKVTKSNDGNVGNRPINVALDQASLWAMYTFYTGPVAGLGLGAGVRYVGESFGDAANTIHIPSFTLYDAVISYDFSYLRPDWKGWHFQVNATNLADTYYVPACVTSIVYCSIGARRAILGTLRYSWQQASAPLSPKIVK